MPAICRKRRKRSRRPKKTRRKDPKGSIRLKALWADPEWRAALTAKFKEAAARRKDNPEKYYRRGVPDGMRKAKAERLWSAAREQAKRFIKIMEDNGAVEAVVIPGSEAEMAKKALEAAYAHAIGPLGDAKTKAAAPRRLRVLRQALRQDQDQRGHDCPSGPERKCSKRFVKRIVRAAHDHWARAFIVLKARQQGLSTVISAWQYFWVSAQGAEGPRDGARSGQHHNAVRHVQARSRQHARDDEAGTKYSSKRARVQQARFGLRVATAGGRGVARGETLQVIHLSEVAFWPTAFARRTSTASSRRCPTNPAPRSSLRAPRTA
jgi:hypothetical protein